MMIDTKSRTLLIIDMKPFCYVMLEVVRHCFKQNTEVPMLQNFPNKINWCGLSCYGHNYKDDKL